jgi:hypothetical protein
MSIVFQNVKATCLLSEHLDLKRPSPLIILFVIIVSLFLVYNPPLARADAQAPTLAVGDHWTYGATGTGPGFSLSLTISYRVADLETFNDNGTNYDSYRIAASSTGSATGPALTAPVSQRGYSIWRRSDLAGVAGGLSTSFIINGLNYTQSGTETTSTPQVMAQFPLYLGESWTSTLTSYTSQTTYDPGLPPSTISYSNTTTTTYVVTSTPLVTVSAGTFETYLIRSSDPTGTSEVYYSPEVLQPIKEVDYNSTGATTQTVQLESYDAWPFSTPLTVSRSGTNYNVVVDTDVAATNAAQNPTTITFQVNGTDGVTGRANVTIPIGANNTAITVKVDSTVTTATILKDSSNYYVYFNFPLSSHTITITYATNPGLSLTLLLIIGILAAVAAVVIVVTFLLIRNRKAPEEIPQPGLATPPFQPPPPGETPPAPPPTETPPPPPPTNPP